MGSVGFLSPGLRLCSAADTCEESPRKQVSVETSLAPDSVPGAGGKEGDGLCLPSMEFSVSWER